MPTPQAGSGFDIRRLKELRTKAGLTQKQLAEKAGVNSISVSLWENGHAKPWRSTLAKLAAALSACGMEIGGGADVARRAPLLASPLTIAVCAHDEK